MADPQASVAAVGAYELLPAGLETVVGWGLPFAEIALGLLLLAGVATRAAAAASRGAAGGLGGGGGLSGGRAG